MRTSPTILRSRTARDVLPALPLGSLEQFGEAPALVTPDAVLTYTELGDLVRKRSELLGTTRSLVLLECRNDVETVVSYLAALQGHHPVLLAGSECRRDELLATYRPNVVANGSHIDMVDRSDHDLHPDLALLMSTSGSTGSPKLVRLSRDNVASNASSIATYLGLTCDDRAATTLPMHYCYGLSVLNSHLLVGASLLLTETSVIDERFWTDFNKVGVTSFAGVPHVFDLLDSSGFADRDLPTLRTVTQAGGRLDPATVRRYALLGEQRNFALVVMYGQTEATARMSYLPAHLAAERPESIGIPVPGGAFRIDCTEDVGAPGCTDLDAEVGELVYSGDNVMLGYAHAPADLALGRTVHELRTGDLARQHEDGLFELVGRTTRFAKLFGIRVDLDRVENLANHKGCRARALECDGRLHLFITTHRDLEAARTLGRSLGLPDHVLEVHVLKHQPVTASGKPDYGALLDQAQAAARSGAADTEGVVTSRRVRDLYAHLLGRPDATVDDSFISLRGDSLSYVEASVRLGRLLHDLPADWAQLSARRLSTHAQARRSWRDWAPVETSVALRAAAIVLIVGTHANLITVMGGAHILLAVVGFNLARFQLSERPRADRRRGLLLAARNVAVPSALWIGATGLLTDMYDASTALMLNNLLGSDTWDVRWQFWFLEVVVWTMVAASLVLSIPTVDRLERARPFAVATTVFVAALITRYALAGIEAGADERYSLPVVLWCVGLGWMAARAETLPQRFVTSLAAFLACWGYFGDPVREGLVAAGVGALIWLPRLRVPAVLLSLLSGLASSSLFVYLTHWQVYPHLEVDHPFWATVASFAVGALVWRCYGLLSATGATMCRRRAGQETTKRAAVPVGDGLLGRFATGRPATSRR